MKGIIFLACAAACLFLAIMSVYCVITIDDTFAKWYITTLCAFGAFAYGCFAYEKRPWGYEWYR